MKNIANSIVFAFCIFIIVFIVSTFFTGCNKENVKPIELHFLDGNWEVVYTDNQEVLGIFSILEITTESNNSEGGGCIKRGKITTYYANSFGTKFYDKVFKWKIYESEEGELSLNLELESELDSESLLDDNYFYKIIRLNDTHMWWQPFSNGDQGTVKMRRRTDL